MPDDDDDLVKPELTPEEHREVEQRSALRVHVVHEAIRREGEEELRRPTSALAWSGLAAGLSMGFSLIGEGLLRAYLPDAAWRPLVSKLGYTLGFVVVILARQQLFTENTLTGIIPLLARRKLSVFANVMRLWGVVLAANLAGAVAVAWVMGNTEVFDAEIRRAFAELGREAVRNAFWTALLRGIFAGWLIALMVWMLPVAHLSRLATIVLVTYIVGLGRFPHIVAGSVEVLYLVTTGQFGPGAYLAGYVVPVLIGNIVGGVALVSVLNHAQVVSGGGDR